MSKSFPPLDVFDAFCAPHVCGHRGHSIGGHENSCMALKLAKTHGASMCEIDLQLTADGQFIVFHDEILDVASTGRGFVGAHRLSELQALHHRVRTDGTVTGEALLSFAQVLDAAKGLGLCLMVELKSTLTRPEQFDLLESSIRNAGMMQRVIIISFDFRMLKHLKHQHPLLPTLGIVHSRHLDPATIARQAELDVYLVDYTHFNAADANALHDAGFRSAHFVPPPHVFEKMGAEGEARLKTLAAQIRAGNIDIFGSDDVQWARAFVDRALAAQNVQDS